MYKDANLLFVFAIVIFFRGFSPTSDQIFIAHVALGYAAFTFLISTLSQGCNVFKSSATWIKSVNLPHSIYVFKSIAGALVPFFINFTLAIIIMISFGLRFEPSAILFVPALGLYLLNAISIQYLFGLIAARWPDFQHLIAAVTRLFFFITPILWVYEDMSGRRKLLADLNPFTHFVDIFRAPLLGQPYIENSWLISLGWTLAGWLAAIIVANAMRRRLPFWV